MAELWLRDQALATSGSGTQYFSHNGRRYGHLLDPHTGLPAEGVYTATVDRAHGRRGRRPVDRVLHHGP